MDPLNGPYVAQHAVLEAVVQEVGVGHHDIIHRGGHGTDVVFQGAPVGLQHLKGHEVLEVLNVVDHALEEGKGR